MKLLLDTHVLIWWDRGVELPDSVVVAIRDADLVFVSAATAWEIAIKASLGRLRTRRTVAAAAAESGFDELPIRIRHAAAVAELPWHHRDPFDRILAAQAGVEGLTLVTRDPIFARYGVRTLPA